MKLEIIETPDYFFITDKSAIEIGGYGIHNNEEYRNKYWKHDKFILVKCTESNKVSIQEHWDNIIAYQPKGNELELDLPLLPEIVVEDDVEKLAELKYPIKGGGSMWMPSSHDCNQANKQEGFIEGYKAATKIYSEEDLVKALSESFKASQEGYDISSDEIIQFLKQPKTPKCFVAEMEYYYHSSKEFYSDAGFVKCSKEQYDSIKDEIPTCPLKTELKTETINGKTYLVGTSIVE